MAHNFHLPSLDLTSPFEDPAGELALPGVVAEGADPAVAVLTGAYRPPTSVCRFLHTEGLVGIQLGGELPPVLRVRLVLRTDWLTDKKWRERNQRIVDARALRGIATDDVELEIEDRPRLVEVQAQGRVRAHALLRRDDEPDAWVRQRLAFDVRTDELDESGLLLIGVGPTASTDGLPDPAVGVVVRRIKVEVPDGPLPGTVSTGRPGADGWAPYDVRAGYAVVNAPDEHTPVRVEVSRESAPAGRFAGRLAKRRPADLDVSGTDATGGAVALTDLRRDPAGSVSFEVPAGAGPVRVRVTEVGVAPGAGAGIVLRTGAGE